MTDTNQPDLFDPWREHRGVDRARTLRRSLDYRKPSQRSARIVADAAGLASIRLHPFDCGQSRVGDSPTGQIGRASCRERVCQSVSISVVAFSFKQTPTRPPLTTPPPTKPP